MSGRRIVIDLDQDGCYGQGGYQVNIGVVDENGSGHGYRIFGPKYAGCDKQRHIKRHVLTPRDAREIRSYLDDLPPECDECSGSGAVLLPESEEHPNGLVTGCSACNSSGWGVEDRRGGRAVRSATVYHFRTSINGHTTDVVNIDFGGATHRLTPEAAEALRNDLDAALEPMRRESEHAAIKDAVAPHPGQLRPPGGGVMHVAHVATAQDGCCYQVQILGQTLRLTWAQAEDLHRQLGERLTEQNEAIDRMVEAYKDGDTYLFKGESPW